MGKNIGAEISENSSRHLQNQRPTVTLPVVHAFFLKPKVHQTVLNCRRLGKRLGAQEHLFISAKINYIIRGTTYRSAYDISDKAIYIQNKKKIGYHKKKANGRH
jgi:hypothetical protein